MQPRTNRRHVVQDAAREFAEAIAAQCHVAWLTRWSRLVKCCGWHHAGTVRDADLLHYVQRVRSAGDSAALFNVDVRPLFFDRPDDERTMVLKTIGAVRPGTAIFTRK